jgi:hypothetical protein
LGVGNVEIDQAAAIAATATIPMTMMILRISGHPLPCDDARDGTSLAVYG